MGYEPRLLIKYDDLKNIESQLEEEQYSNNRDTQRIAIFLLEELKFKDLLPNFNGVKVTLAYPEFPTFNALVRERLDEGGVHYITFN